MRKLLDMLLSTARSGTFLRTGMPLAALLGWKDGALGLRKGLRDGTACDWALQSVVRHHP